MKRRQRQKKGWRRVEGEIGRKRKGSKRGGKEGEGGKGEETKEEKEEGEAREGQHHLAGMEGAIDDRNMYQLYRMYLNLRKHGSLPFTVLTSSSLKRFEKHVIT